MSKEKKAANQENKEELALKLKLEEYTNTLKVLQADFQNYIKRAEKEKKEHANYAAYKLLASLVDINDNFERALEALTKVQNKEVAEGISMIHKEFNKLLENEGVRKMECLGKKFDPYNHEILDIAEGNEDDLIVEELQKGYFLHDKILRTAKVRISKVKGEKENVQC